MKELHRLTIEKLVFGGQGLAHMPDGQAVFVWNAIPGEVVEVEIIKRKKTYLEAVARNIITPSEHRRDPREPHYLSSSAWAIMSPEHENFWKRSIAAEVYSKFADYRLEPGQLTLVEGDHLYAYRNKIEFSFCVVDSTSTLVHLGREHHFSLPNPEGTKLSLAFYQRGSHEKIPVKRSDLAEPVINTVATNILDWMNDVGVPVKSIKSLVVRSNGAGEAIAALFLKDKLRFDHYPTLDSELLGFHIYQSDRRSPASVPTEKIHTDGPDTLTADILGTKLQFGLLSFFQVNIPVFDRALQDIAAFIKPDEPLVDFYAGVGSIGLPISQSRPSLTLVESNDEAVAFAEANIKTNNRTNTNAILAPAEAVTDEIPSSGAVIVDPPRAGLHPDVTRALLTKAPEKILYLSCGLDTQARDLKLLSERYSISFLTLYNFFPRTPHIEALAVLEKMW